MFIVRPFEQPKRIRSSLGFMSLASRWGEYLFPGITVLTRDVRDLKAMHDIALEMGLDGTPSPQLQKFQSRDSDHRVAHRLKRFLRKEGIEGPLPPLTQQATYWQRYGSTFNHFKLFSIKHPRSPDTFKKLIFSNNSPFPACESPSTRKRRVRHFTWYSKFRRNLERLDTEQDTSRLLRGPNPNNALRRWWLAPSLHYESLSLAIPKIPPPIRLVRELEYALIVFQIIFEAASLLSKAGAFVIPKGSDLRAGPIELVRSYLNVTNNLASIDELRSLLAIALHCYENDLAARLPLWAKRVKEEIEAPEVQHSLITFHGDRSISDFAKYDRKELLQQLAELHVDYCNQQAKLHAIVVERFFPKPKLGPQGGELTPTFSNNRWGLHGYRFEAAIAFGNSEKYG
jgi:hypothetical protein